MQRILCGSIILGLMLIFSGRLRAQELPAELKKSEQLRVQMLRQACLTAVCVFGPAGQGGGSGVVVSPDGYALSNYHVVESCGPFMKCGMADGVRYDAVIVGIDPTGDVALIKLLGRNDFPYAKLADSDQVEMGDTCFSIGNPFLLATDFQPSVSMGIVSGTHRYQYPSGTLLEYSDCIQTDAAINPGNSGGPLFNQDGEVIGINGRGSFEKRGRVNVGVGYAISANQVKLFLSHLKSGRIVDHATIGATLRTDESGQVRVANLLETSQAFQLGLEYDDEIVSFAGRPVDSVNQFKNILGILPAGFHSDLVYRRGDQEFSLRLRLPGLHGPGELAELIGADVLPRAKGDEEESKLAKGSADSGGPAEFKHLFEQKPGFVNYYFNRLHRDNVWQKYLTTGPLRSRGKWKLEGQDKQRREWTIVLNDQGSGIRRDGRSFVLDQDSDLSNQSDPPNSGGLLVALHQWREFLVLGPEKFGEVTYHGLVPRREAGAPLELLVGLRDGVETHFLFDTESHKLRWLETYLDSDSLPCEIQFSEYQAEGEFEFPRELKYRVGLSQPVTVRMKTVTF